MNDTPKMFSKSFLNLAEEIEKECGDWENIPDTVSDFALKVRIFDKVKEIEKKNNSDTDMQVLVMTIKLYAPFVQSIKEKQMIVKNLKTKLNNLFYVSVTEIDAYDDHKTIIIGVAAIIENTIYADKLVNAIKNFIACNAEVELIEFLLEEH